MHPTFSDRREMIKRKITAAITISPDELAAEFADMDDEEQVMFFNELARITEKWDRPFCFQLRSIMENPNLTNGGRSIMEQIGQYGQVD
jgi:diadenosine tetraphosphate (Ap4A) HIT family hydrolase